MARNKALRELEALLAYAEQLRSALPGAPPVPACAAVRTTVTRPRVGVGVALTCPDAQPGRVLIGERVGSHGAGAWALPGGHLELGHAWAMTASQEVAEETGLDVAPGRFTFVAVTNDPMPEDGLHYVTIFMHAVLSAAEASSVRNTEEDKCVGWHWLSFEEVSVHRKFVPLDHFIEAGHLRRLLATA